MFEANRCFCACFESVRKGDSLLRMADNLGAHSLVGIQESLKSDKMCRFCLIIKHEAKSGQVEISDFKLRNVEKHNSFDQEVQTGESLQNVSGMTWECVLSTCLSFILSLVSLLIHYMIFLEGIVHAELSLCLKDLISKGNISFDELNHCIKSFLYKDSDSVNKPKVLTKSSFTKGGNAHENWTLLRLLPFMIGHKIPEN